VEVLEDVSFDFFLIYSSPWGSPACIPSQCFASKGKLELAQEHHTDIVFRDGGTAINCNNYVLQIPSENSPVSPV